MSKPGWKTAALVAYYRGMLLRILILFLVAHVARAEESASTAVVLCLENDTTVSPEKFEEALSHWFPPDSYKIASEEKGPEQGWTVLFEIDGKRHQLAHSQHPVPEEELQYACGNSFLWPDAGQILSRHKAHLRLTNEGEFKSAAARNLELSKFAAAMSEAFGATGVLWEPASVVHEPTEFRLWIRKAGLGKGELPVHAWIGFLNARNESGGIDMFTKGLDRFGVMEIEVLNSKRTANEIYERLAFLSAYLIEHGNVIKDGGTIGSTHTEVIQTRHEDSVIGRKDKVIRVEL